MLVLLGGSGSGKSTIEKEFVERNGMEKLVVYTTRPIREGEVDGTDYHFVDDNKFMKMVCDKAFVSTTKYNNWHYGIAKKDCTDNKIAVITPADLRQLSKHKELNIFSVYIEVPLRERLIRVLKRGDDVVETFRRCISDEGQFDSFRFEADLTVTNNKYCKSIEEIYCIINKFVKY